MFIQCFCLAETDLGIEILKGWRVKGEIEIAREEDRRTREREIIGEGWAERERERKTKAERNGKMVKKEQ